MQCRISDNTHYGQIAAAVRIRTAFLVCSMVDAVLQDILEPFSFTLWIGTYVGAINVNRLLPNLSLS